MKYLFAKDFLQSELVYIHQILVFIKFMINTDFQLISFKFVLVC